MTWGTYSDSVSNFESSVSPFSDCDDDTGAFIAEDEGHLQRIHSLSLIRVDEVDSGVLCLDEQIPGRRYRDRNLTDMDGVEFTLRLDLARAHHRGQGHDRSTRQ